MKKVILTIIVLLFMGLIPILHSCKKDEVPTLTTTTVTNITGTAATSGGVISDEGSATVVDRGICWSKGGTPTVDDNITMEGGGAGTFISNMSDLDAATTYYVRAYAKNSAGTGYGMAMSFTTLGQAPSATTQGASDITLNSATLNSTINANYLSTIVSFEFGATSNYGQTITPSQSPVTGNSNTSVTTGITGLTEGTTYHFRVKTENSLGTTFGDDMSFTTLGQVPVAATQSATNITLTEATLNGMVNANYLSAIVSFEYGTTLNYGETIPAIQNPVTGNTDTSVSAGITGLLVGTTYHYRIKAENSLGTTYSNDISFTTLGQVPSVSTQGATLITSLTARLYCNVNANYLSTVVTFEYGTTVSYGSTVTAYQSPVSGNTNILVSADLSGLTEGTTYHFRVKAVNSLGTTYSDDMIFTTSLATLADVEGNEKNYSTRLQLLYLDFNSNSRHSILLF